MRLHNFTYLIKEGARNLLSNKLMSFACIGVLVACLLLIGGAAMFTLTVNNVVGYVEDQNEVVAFLEDGLSKQDIEVIDLSLRNVGNILQITFVDKEQVLLEEKEKAGEFSDLYAGLEEDNPFPDKYILRIDDLSILQQTVEQIAGIEGVYKVNAQTEVAAILTGVKQTVTIAGMVVVLILVAVSVVIITNTIKLTVFSRRKEINIMKYVGATDWFIRLPFLVEGMLIGLLSALLAFLILGFGYTYLLDWVGKTYGQYITIVYENAVNFWDVSLYILAGFAGLGIFIGAVGSGFFVRKYLKV